MSFFTVFHILCNECLYPTEIMIKRTILVTFRKGLEIKYENYMSLDSLLIISRSMSGQSTNSRRSES